MVSPLPGHKSIFTPILKEKKIDLSREEFWHLNPEDGGSELLWDVGIYISDYSVLTWKFHKLCSNYRDTQWHLSTWRAPNTWAYWCCAVYRWTVVKSHVFVFMSHCVFLPSSNQWNGYLNLMCWTMGTLKRLLSVGTSHHVVW
jgi:hypothetical protein